MKLFGHERRSHDSNGVFLEAKASPAQAVTKGSLPALFGADSGRRLVVSLEAGDLITFRPARTPRRYSMRAVDVFAWVLRCRANAAQLEKAREAKDRRAKRLAAARQERAERRLFKAK
jgi:hypothetical protein